MLVLVIMLALVLFMRQRTQPSCVSVFVTSDADLGDHVTMVLVVIKLVMVGACVHAGLGVHVLMLLLVFMLVLVCLVIMLVSHAGLGASYMCS